MYITNTSVLNGIQGGMVSSKLKKNNLSNFNIPNNHIPNVIEQKGSQVF